jgi:predicted dehydrogenase
VTTTGPTVGIIGLGYGRAHVPAFQAQGCRVVALCQRDEAGARQAAERYGVPRVFADWEVMLETARPDIVVIATPPHLHRVIALRALGAGAHVLCEKPLALTLGEARAMTEAAARAGRVAMTAFNWRFAAAMSRLNAVVRGGALGRVFHVSTRWLGGRWADPAAAATWRMDRAQAGHGAMGDMGVHLVDMVRWSFGEFVRVAAQRGVAYPSRSAPGVARPADAEDYCTVLAELEGGALVTLVASRVAHAMNEHTLEAYGSAGALHYRLGREGARWWDGELRVSKGSAGWEPVEPGAAPAAPEGDQLDVIGRTTIAPLVARMLEGIRAGRTPSPSFEDGLRAQAVLDAALAAVARGGWVEVERG